jgi:hypothetical protein
MIPPAPTSSEAAFNRLTPLSPAVLRLVDSLNLLISCLRGTLSSSGAAHLESESCHKEMSSPILATSRTGLFIALPTKKHYDPSIYAILSVHH